MTHYQKIKEIFEAVKSQANGASLTEVEVETLILDVVYYVEEVERQAEDKGQQGMYSLTQALGM